MLKLLQLISLNYHERRFATSSPPVWRDACWIKVQANQPLSLRDSRTKQLLPAGSSGCGFNCLPCCTSSLPPLISPEEKKRAALTGGSIGIQFCRKQPFYHSGQMWKSVSVGSKKIHLKIQYNHRLFSFSFFQGSSSWGHKTRKKITVGFCSKLGRDPRKNIFYFAQRFWFSIFGRRGKHKLLWCAEQRINNKQE